MFCCNFLTDILQNRRKRISATLLDDGIMMKKNDHFTLHEFGYCFKLLGVKTVENVAVTETSVRAQ